MALQQGADLVYHDLFIVDNLRQTSFPKKICSNSVEPPVYHSLLCGSISIPNSSIVVRKDLLETVHGVTEDRQLISVEDFDTLLRLSTVSENFVRLPFCDGFYWTGGGNISTASSNQQRIIRALYAKHLPNLPPKIQKRAASFLEYRVARIAHQHRDFKTAIKCYLFILRSSLPFL